MQDSRTICYGLMRACGTIGFLLGATIVLRAGQQHFHLDLSAGNLHELSRRQIVLLVAALAAAMAAGALGQGIGALIPIRNDKRARDIDAIWHFGANSVIIWNIVAMLVFGLAMGREAARAFRATHSTVETIWLGIAIPVLAGWSILFLSWFSVEIVPKFAGVAAVMLMGYVAPAVAGIVLGAFEARELGLNPRWGLVMAAIPLVLIPTALDFMRKDAQRRIGS